MLLIIYNFQTLELLIINVKNIVLARKIIGKRNISLIYMHAFTIILFKLYVCTRM